MARSNSELKELDLAALVEELRAEGVTVPLVLMGYANPFYQYGIEKLAARAVGVVESVDRDFFARLGDGTPDLLPLLRGNLDHIAVLLSLRGTHGNYRFTHREVLA